MLKENQSDPRTNLVPRYLPWLLGGIMFIAYGLTLNHWVTLLNIGPVANVSGWVWQPQVYNPLTYLVTLPFRWLPAALIPVALNILSALCAAATLAVLARSVAILPHDRTEMERMRERSDFSFLTGWVAWAPPIVAVFFAGFQLGFWENATSFTGGSFNVLWFAVIVWQLLEYRLDEREVRLYAAALLFGAGMTEDWALVGFFPVFLMMIIWLRKLDFFNFSFLLRMSVFGLVGMLLFFLLPVIAKISTNHSLTIWDSLKLNLQSDWLVVKSAQQATIRHSLALIALTSLFPAFIMSIRWSATFGDSSRMGATLVNYIMHVVNTILFGLLLWVMLDPPLSPVKLTRELGLTVPALTFYYVGALCIGYYCGYLLLVFGKRPVPSRRNPRPEQALPKSLVWLLPVIVGGLFVATGLLAATLLYRNLPIIRAVNDDSLLKYARFTVQNLPREGAVLLCDTSGADQNQSLQTLLMQAVLARDGRAHDFPVVDTQSLNWQPYHDYLHKRYPKLWPANTSTNRNVEVNPLQIVGLLTQFARSNNLYYLNPSFGYYFEQFYQEPHGLIYLLKLLPENSGLPPLPSKEVLAENEAFWTPVLASSRPAIEKAQNPVDYRVRPGPANWVMMHLHVTSEANPNALLVGTFYSRALNYLGVQVQRSGDTTNAATLFADAQLLNSNNVVAGINLAFNKTLQARLPTEVDLSRATADQFGKYRNWNDVIIANGPFDEPSFCFESGIWYMQGGLLRQAAVAFDRVHQLAPNNLAARLFLAQIYIIGRKPDLALDALHDPLTHPAKFALTDYNSTELNVLAAAAHFQKSQDAQSVALLNKEIDRHPDNEALLTMSVQSFFMRGLYTNALRTINIMLARSPNDVTWIYGKGFASLHVGAYQDAVNAFSRVLEIQTNNPDVLFNRAIAYLDSDQLDAARADFSQLQTSFTNAFQVAYGLAEVAWRRHETNEAIRNYRIYLNSAPTNALELKTAQERFSQLGGK